MVADQTASRVSQRTTYVFGNAARQTRVPISTRECRPWLPHRPKDDPHAYGIFHPLHPVQPAASSNYAVWLYGVKSAQKKRSEYMSAEGSEGRQTIAPITSPRVRYGVFSNRGQLTR
jgi:hypothetical protein